MLLFLLPAAAAAIAPAPITNARVVIDMVQNNPGDPVGWEQSKYFNPAVLKQLGYSVRIIYISLPFQPPLPPFL